MIKEFLSTLKIHLLNQAQYDKAADEGKLEVFSLYLTPVGITPISEGGTGANNVEDARTNLGVAPTSHASTSTAYGRGDLNNYGHVKLLNSTNSGDYTEDENAACTPAAVKSAIQMYSSQPGTFKMYIDSLKE